MNKDADEESVPDRSAWKRLMPVAVLVAAVLALGAMLFGPGESSAAAPVRVVRLVKTFPHDPKSFCQGLVVHNGAILEGTGHYRESRLRLVALETGKPTVDAPLQDNEFGEGITVWGNTIVQLTWKVGYIIMWDATTMQRRGTYPLKKIDPGLREGWGITHDGKHLIISDGSSTLRFVEPSTMKLVKTLRVKDGRRYVSKLNELEFVNGEIFANIWYRDQIARIDPETGRVNSWLELKHLRPREVRFNREAVLNGIAWDEKNQRLFVTGKYWPKLFEITF